MFLKTKRKKNNPILEESDTYSIFFKNVSTYQCVRRKATGGFTDPVTLKSKKGKADGQFVGPKISQYRFSQCSRVLPVEAPSVTQPGSSVVAQLIYRAESTLKNVSPCPRRF